MSSGPQLVTVEVNLIPQGGTDADRVNIPAHLAMFGTAKADIANNTLRIGDKSYMLDSLQFSQTNVSPPPPPPPPGP
jgi:hypothetical protein